MKSFLKLLTIAVFLLASTPILNAQTPPHPNNGAAPSIGNGNTPVGAGAPIGSGTLLLLGLAGLYGGKKLSAWENVLKNHKLSPGNFHIHCSYPG